MFMVFSQAQVRKLNRGLINQIRVTLNTSWSREAYKDPLSSSSNAGFSSSFPTVEPMVPASPPPPPRVVILLLCIISHTVQSFNIDARGSWWPPSVRRTNTLVQTPKWLTAASYPLLNCHQISPYPEHLKFKLKINFRLFAMLAFPW